MPALFVLDHSDFLCRMLVETACCFEFLEGGVEYFSSTLCYSSQSQRKSSDWMKYALGKRISSFPKVFPPNKMCTDDIQWLCQKSRKYRANTSFLSFAFGHGLGRQVECREQKSLPDSDTEITSVGIPSETN